MSDPKALADRLQAYEEERCLGHFDCPIPHDLFRDVEALLRALAAAAPPLDRNDLLGGQGGRTADPPATQRQTLGGELLKLCPWCGELPDIEEYAVGCKNPCCEAQPSVGGGMNQAECISAWNNRSGT